MNFFTKLINSLQTFAQNIRFSRTSPAPVSKKTEVIEPEISTDSPIEIIKQVIKEVKKFIWKAFQQTVQATNEVTAIAVHVGGVMLGYCVGTQLLIGLAIPFWAAIQVALYGFALVLIVDMFKRDIQTLKNNIQQVL